MRYYIEATERTVDMETTPEFIRIEVTDMTEAEEEQVKTAIKDIMAGKDYRLVKHECDHESPVDRRLPCVMTDIEG